MYGDHVYKEELSVWYEKWQKVKNQEKKTKAINLDELTKFIKTNVNFKDLAQLKNPSPESEYNKIKYSWFEIEELLKIYDVKVEIRPELDPIPSYPFREFTLCFLVEALGLTGEERNTLYGGKFDIGKAFDKNEKYKNEDLCKEILKEVKEMLKSEIERLKDEFKDESWEKLEEKLEKAKKENKLHKLSKEDKLRKFFKLKEYTQLLSDSEKEVGKYTIDAIKNAIFHSKTGIQKKILIDKFGMDVEAKKTEKDTEEAQKLRFSRFKLLKLLYTLTKVDENSLNYSLLLDKMSMENVDYLIKYRGPENVENVDFIRRLKAEIMKELSVEYITLVEKALNCTGQIFLGIVNSWLEITLADRFFDIAQKNEKQAQLLGTIYAIMNTRLVVMPKLRADLEPHCRFEELDLFEIAYLTVCKFDFINFTASYLDALKQIERHLKEYSGWTTEIYQELQKQCANMFLKENEIGTYLKENQDEIAKIVFYGESDSEEIEKNKKSILAKSHYNAYRLLHKVASRVKYSDRKNEEGIYLFDLLVDMHIYFWVFKTGIKVHNVCYRPKPGDSRYDEKTLSAVLQQASQEDNNKVEPFFEHFWLLLYSSLNAKLAGRYTMIRLLNKLEMEISDLQLDILEEKNIALLVDLMWGSYYLLLEHLVKYECIPSEIQGHPAEALLKQLLQQRLPEGIGIQLESIENPNEKWIPFLNNNRVYIKDVSDGKK